MRRFLRGSAKVSAWSLMGLSAAILAARFAGVTQITAVALLVGAPFVGGLSAIATGLSVATRSRAGIVAGTVLTAVLVGIQVPQFVPDAEVASGSEITVLTVNAAHGEADAQAIVDEVRSSDADFLAVQELTPEHVEALTAAGIGDVLPYDFTVPLPVADGTGLWSRTPLTDGTRLDGFGFVPVSARTVVHGVDMTVVSFHAMSPATPRHTEQWDADLAHMRSLMDTYPGTVLVAGDFNATGDHRQFRDLASNGFVDAAERAGAGLFRTFPASTPLARLDHVVTSDTVDALEVRPVQIPDSDHLGVSATLRLPNSEAR